MASVTAPQALKKQPSEVRTFTMDFDNLLDTSETISTISSITSSIEGSDSLSDLTIASQAISSDGKSVTFIVSDGIDGKIYRIEVIVVTSASSTLEGDGLLKIRDR